jgi:hypothetical protein
MLKLKLNLEGTFFFPLIRFYSKLLFVYSDVGYDMSCPRRSLSINNKRKVGMLKTKEYIII